MDKGEGKDKRIYWISGEGRRRGILDKRGGKDRGGGKDKGGGKYKGLMFLLRKGTPHQPPVITIFNICRWWQEQPILKIYKIVSMYVLFLKKRKK